MMAILLAAVEAKLRSDNNWDENQCGIQPDGLPPKVARGFYVAVDERSEEERSSEDAYYLEIWHNIEVTICIDVAAYQRDRTNQMLRKQNLYQSTIESFDTLQVKVLNSLHKNYTLVTQANTLGDYPDTTKVGFLTPLHYKGRQKHEILTLPESEATQTTIKPWHGRRLTFRGMKRTHKVGEAA